MYGEEDPYYITGGLRSAVQNGGKLTRVGDGGALFQQVQYNQCYPLGLAISGVSRSLLSFSES